MDLTSAIALRATTAFIKKIIDDVYVFGKTKISYKWDDWRTSIKERGIARSISKITHVKTLWNIEKEVSLYDFYYPSQIEFGSGVAKKIESLKDLGARNNFVIQGTAGQGKSIFLRYLCGQELRDQYTTERIPVFIELRRLKSSLDLQGLILESLSKYGIKSDANALEVYAESGKFVFLLDAFDEIDPAISQDALGQIEYFAEKFQDRLQIIITARPNADIQYSSRFRVCKLKPLRSSDHLPFLKKICLEKNQAEDLAKVIVSSTIDVKELLTTPLMLTLLVILYKSVQMVPDTVPRFYEELFDVLFYRHDHSKPGFRRKRYTNLDDSTIRSLFAAFSFYVRLKSYTTITMRELEECCVLACKAIGVSVDPKKFKDEIAKTVCLMQEEGFELSFIHKSVAEYYAASFVKDSSDKFVMKFYDYVTSSPFKAGEWALELKFLAEIDRYRNAKYFTLQLISALENSLDIVIDNNISDVDISKLIKFLSTDSYVRFSEDLGGKYRASGWERTIVSNPILEEVSNLWLRTFSSYKTPVEIPSNYLKAIDEEIESAERYNVHTEFCSEIFPVAVLADAKKKIVSFLVNEKANATEIVLREEEKSLLIDHLLSVE